MSQWSDRISNHPVWSMLNEFGPIIDQAISIHGRDPEIEAGLLRLKTLLTFIGKRLNAADPILIPTESLDQIFASFERAMPALAELMSEGDPGQLLTANSELDAALTAIGGICVPLTSDEVGALKDSADEYRRSMQQNSESAVETVADLLRDVSAARAELANLRIEMESSGTQFRSETTNELNALRTQVAAEKARADAVIVEYQSQFSSSQEKRQSDFGVMIESWRADFAEHQTSLKSDREELQSHSATEADKILREMNERRSEIERLVGIIGNLGMTSGFQKAAATALITTRVWNGVTVVAIVGLIAWFSWMHSSPTSIENLQWPALLFRIVVTLPFGVLAAYAAKQADKYLNIHRLNQKLELELQAVGPYLAPLPETEQNSFRLALAKKIFGRNEMHPHRRGDKSPATIFDILASDELREIVEKSSPQLSQAMPDLLKALPEIITAIKK